MSQGASVRGILLGPEEKSFHSHCNVDETWKSQEDREQDMSSPPGHGRQCVGLWLRCEASEGGQKGVGSWSWPFRGSAKGAWGRVMTELKLACRLHLSQPDTG